MSSTRFTVLGHSCLYVETPAGSILVDPWLFGSAGWRSWWHYPPVPELRSEWMEPDFLYLTHHHPDHFHYPSMRRISKRARVLVPRFGVDVMPGELRGLGFQEVTELPHGRPLELGSGVRVASYQYGFDDTTFVIQTPDATLVDLNDCKIRGRALRKLARDFPSADFAFKGHSFAQAYPHCYEADDPADLALIDRGSYIEDFLDAMRVLKPRYAIPFGSMVGFLHPESFHVNRHLVTPAEVVAAVEADPTLEGTRAVAMAPGDRWESDTGFDLAPTDWYTDREARLEALTREVAARIEASLAEEARRQVSWPAFEAYFGTFLASLPPPSGRLLVPRCVVFEIPSAAPERFFCLDFRQRRASRSASPPPDHACVIRTPEGVLADAMEKRIVHYIHGSMRIHTLLRPGGIGSDLAFWGLLTMWEMGYLPPRRALGRRVVGAALARWREGLDLLGGLLGPGGAGIRLARRFAAARGLGPPGSATGDSR